MKKLNVLLLKSFIGPLLLTFFIALFILLLQFLWKYVDDLVGKGLDLGTIAQFMFYASWTMVPMALPLAVLLSSLMVFGNLGEHYELVAMKAAGISLRKAMRPLVIACVLVCGIAFYFANYAVPNAYKNYRKIYYEIRTKKPAINIREGEYYNKLEGYVIRLGQKEEDGHVLKDVQIYDHTDKQGNVRVTMSKTGSMEISKDERYLIFNLQDGYTYSEETQDPQTREARPFTRIKFKKQCLVFDLSEFDLSQNEEGMFDKHHKGLTIAQLNVEMDTIKLGEQQRIEEIVNSITGRDHYLRTYASNDSLMALIPAKNAYTLPNADSTVYKSAFYTASNTFADMEYYKADVLTWQEKLNAYGVEWHKKFSLSLACLILFFIGAPLGAIIRKGGLGMPVVVSVLLFIAYHVINVIGEKSALKGEFLVWEGVWLAPLIFLPFGIFLTLKATSDSPLLDADVWRKHFKK
ncbi:MAG: LptF/LptG family permease [Bacteroidales bacterium]